MINTSVETEINQVYQDFLNRIYTRFSGNVTYGLERVIAFLNEMGNPEKQLHGIHIAGTNGKGSTSAMCEALALADGKTVGMNTSPHLLDYRERLRINSINVSIEELLTVYNKLEDILLKWEASFFEITTAIAFQLFKEKAVDICIFEVGLGGRLDATNPFSSTVTVITSISLDHRKTLGDSIEKIAYEKAGIIKEGVPVVLGKLPPEAYKVICDIAAETEAPCYTYGKDYMVENVVYDNSGTSFDLIVDNPEIPFPRKVINLHTNMIGQHQARNAALSIIAYSLFEKHFSRSIDSEVIRRGLDKVNWMGRMQIINNEPLTILDCAHNEEGIENLVENLKVLYPGQKFRFVAAILRDKNFHKMIKDLSGIAKKIYIAKNQSERAADAEEQAQIVEEANIECFVGASVTDAYMQAKAESDKNDTIIITGSIYTVSEVIPPSV